MKSEIERYKEALKSAVDFIVKFDPSLGGPTLKHIDCLVNPLPEMETVEVTQYSVYTPKNGGCLGTYHTKEEASRVMSPGFEMVKLTGSYQRPKKQPVEKSVSGLISGRRGMVPTIDVTIAEGDIPPLNSTVYLTWHE